MKDKLKECLSAFMFLCALTCQLFFEEFKVGKQTLHHTPGDKHKNFHRHTNIQLSNSLYGKINSPQPLAIANQAPGSCLLKQFQNHFIPEIQHRD